MATGLLINYLRVINFQGLVKRTPLTGLLLCPNFTILSILLSKENQKCAGWKNEML